MFRFSSPQVNAHVQSALVAQLPAHLDAALSKLQTLAVQAQSEKTLHLSSASPNKSFDFHAAPSPKRLSGSGLPTETEGVENQSTASLSSSAAELDQSHFSAQLVSLTAAVEAHAQTLNAQRTELEKCKQQFADVQSV